jgi:hypothetical protein
VGADLRTGLLLPADTPLMFPIVLEKVRMGFLMLLVTLSMPSPSALQEPLRVVPGASSVVKPVYRKVKPGEERVEGLLQRVECPPGRPVTFIVKLKDRIANYQAPRLDAVEYIAYTPDFKGPMSCGGRMSGDPVFLTWKTVATAPRVVAVEFLPRK